MKDLQVILLTGEQLAALDQHSLQGLQWQVDTAVQALLDYKQRVHDARASKEKR